MDQELNECYILLLSSVLFFRKLLTWSESLFSCLYSRWMMPTSENSCEDKIGKLFWNDYLKQMSFCKLNKQNEICKQNVNISMLFINLIVSQG